MDRLTRALTEEVSPTLIEYGVQELFKGKSIKSAARSVAKKFDGQTNLFLGQVSLTAGDMEEALWTRLVAEATKAIGRVKPGFEDMALQGTLDFFKQPDALPELKQRMGRS